MNVFAIIEKHRKELLTELSERIGLKIKGMAGSIFGIPILISDEAKEALLVQFESTVREADEEILKEKDDDAKS